MSVVKEEILRKLDHVKRMTIEAENLIKDAQINGESQDLTETIKQQADIIDVLIQKLVKGYKSSDPEVDRKFKRVLSLYRRQLMAEMALEMKDVEQDAFDAMMKKLK